MPAKIEELPLFALTTETDQVVVEVTESLLIDKLAPETAAKVTYDTATRTLTLRERLDEQDLLSLQQCFTTPTGKAAAENLYRRSRNLPVVARLTPSQRGERFSIPVLAIRQGDLFEQFEETHFLERGGVWQIVTHYFQKVSFHPLVLVVKKGKSPSRKMGMLRRISFPICKRK